MRKGLLFLFILILLFSSLGLSAKEFYFNEWIQDEVNQKLFDYFKKRALDANHWYIYYRPELTKNNRMTEQQAHDRVKAILVAAHELNYMYPNIHPRRIFKDFNAIIEYETHFVNYRSMDDGQSFGVVALTWKTAQAAADALGYNLDLYRTRTVNGVKKIYYSEIDRNFMRSNTDLQIKFGVWYYYKLLSKYYNGDRLVALTGYNVGPGLNPDTPRFRNYYFNILGRIIYYEKELAELNKQI